MYASLSVDWILGSSKWGREFIFNPSLFQAGYINITPGDVGIINIIIYFVY